MPIKDKILNSAKLMALTTERKLLEAGTLRTLYSQLFQACEHEAININALAPDEVASVTETRHKISELNTMQPSVTHDSIKAKAIAAAETAQRKVKEQTLKFQLEKQQCEAGRKLYTNFKQNVSSSSKVGQIVAQIDIGETKRIELTTTIESITNDLPWYLKNPKHTAIAIAVLIGILFCSYKYYGWHHSSVTQVSQRHIEKAERDTQQSEQQRIQKQQAENLEATAKIREKDTMEVKQANTDAGLKIAQTNAPASLPADAEAAMQRGLLAGRQQEWMTAIQNFQEARRTAPNEQQLLYDLGLAESHIPGRELRAMCWFGAYLMDNTNTLNAATVKDQIAALDLKCQSNNAYLIKFLQDAATKIPPPVLVHFARPGGLTKEMYDEASKTPGANIRALISVAVLRARVGDIAGALRTADLIQDECSKSPAQAGITADLIKDAYFKNQTQAGIVGIQIEDGDIAGALKTADLIQDANFQSLAQQGIAEARAKANDFAGAQMTAGLIQDVSVKSATQCKIADDQVKAGDLPGAKETLASALKAAELIYDEYSKSRAHGAIANVQVKAGDYAGALRTTGLIQDGNSVVKGTTLLNIANAQVKAGDIAGAKVTVASILQIPNLLNSFQGSIRYLLEHQLVDIQVKVGDFVGALRTSDLILDLTKNQAWAGIAEAQAKAGDIAGAQKTANLIRTWPTTGLSEAREAIAEAQVKAAAFEDALKTADLTQDEPFINRTQAAIIGIQVQHGDIAGALKTVDLIQTGSFKSSAQQFISEARAKAGDIAGAQMTADLIQDVSVKTDTQRKIADAQTNPNSKSNLASTFGPTALIQAPVDPVGSTPVQPSIRVIEVSDWLNELDNLNRKPFLDLDLASYLADMNSEPDPQKLFLAVERTTDEIVGANNRIDKMLKYQAKKL